MPINLVFGIAYLQVLLHASRLCPALCEASVLAGLPDALLQAGTGPHATLALLALASVVQGACRPSSSNGAGPAGATPAQQALAPSAATDAAIGRLAGVCGTLLLAEWGM